MKQNDLFELGKKNIEELNISKYLTFKRCLFEYKLRYIEKNSFNWRPKIKMNFGILLHEIINLYFKKIIIREDKNLIYTLFEDKWLKERSKFIDHEEEYYNKCKNAIDLFINSPISNLFPLALEYKFSKIIKRDLRIIGRIDLIGKVDNDLQIWDFKLDEPEISSGEEEHKKYLQLIFYYFGLGDIFGAVPHILGYYFFSTGQAISIEVYPQLLEKAFKEIENVLDEMKNVQEFIPEINNFCPSCGFEYICPHFDSKKKEV